MWLTHICYKHLYINVFNDCQPTTCQPAAIFYKNLLNLDIDTLSAMGTRQQHIYSTLNSKQQPNSIFDINLTAP